MRRRIKQRATRRCDHKTKHHAKRVADFTDHVPKNSSHDEIRPKKQN